MSDNILRSYIGGRYIDNPSLPLVDNLNPATGEVLCRIQQAGEAEVALAIETARQGFEVWSAMTGAERGRILNRAVQILRERNRELAELEVRDNGKPIQEAEVVDVLSGADCIEYFAGLAASIHGQQFALKGAFAYTRREPLGICFGIGAWNYPLQIACWKSGPALACGNAMIYKPASLTPMTAAKLAEIYTEAGVPDGVFNVIQGTSAAARQLIAHPEVAKVSITGSVDTGKAIMADAAKTLKRITMELGGKSPLVIFDDADLDQAVSAAMLANFYTQGEICTNGTRVFVHDAIYDAFLEKLVSRTRKLKIGDPMDPATQVGAQVSKGHADSVMQYVELGKAEGARLLAGGNRVTVPGCEGGNFIAPTIFADCTDDMSIVREEIFGPVMSVLRFSDEDEVIRRANDTRLGLAAGVFTKDISRAHRVVGKLQAGVCWINNYNITPIEMPFGGLKESGIGSENSMVTLDHYTQLKSVYVELSGVACPYE
ncbi:betaine-aldehyde dehydrogenase [Pseudogulbenkiania subflava]|uniref:Betaine-aldehyde dehydrogenase n=1 Tax=Pseudogulbenkiania subflava DSM 22618 TaxID=1123014 RepID=A0A1Y6C4E9_9NEIS|nr:betaine-aldehyde dehydrogenase [Pseudogulbenkiania subflava]SMF41149.1 betaine-aldehyde dehydrogenase [Pseudogulbenkiania subflava DSM 22618]